MKVAEKIETAIVSYEEKALLEYAITPAEIAKKAAEYMVLKVVPDDTQSYKVARAALTACVSTRTSADKRRKELKADALKWGKAVDDAYKALVAPLAPVEEYLDKELGREDGRKKEIKAKEKARVDEIRAKITEMQKVLPRIVLDYTASQLTEALDKFLSAPATEEVYQEFTAEAVGVWEQVVSGISEAIGAREKLDKGEAERKAEAERLEKVRQEQEAEAARLAAEKKAQEEEQKRIDGIKKKVASISSNIALIPGKTLEDLNVMYDNLSYLEIDEVYEEFQEEARTAKTQVLSTLKVAVQQAEAKAEQEAESKRLADEKRKIQEDKDRAEFERETQILATKKAREEALALVDYVYPFDDLGTMPDVHWSKMYHDHKKAWDAKENEKFIAELKAKREAEDKAKAEAEAKAAKEEADRKAAEEAEKARQEALRPDKEKLIAYGEALCAVTSPSLSDKKAKAILDDVNDGIDHIITLIKTEVEAL